MAAATDELTLLDTVLLRLGSAETDEQLQTSVCKFLPPVLLKLCSTQEGVRKKVLELLIHINKRIRSRPRVQLPIEALLLQYQDPVASSFLINFTIIYIKLGYPRMDMNKQAELLPNILNAIEGKPLSHQDSLLLVIMPALGHIKIPMDPEKKASFLGLQDKPHVTKQLISFMLDVLLLPYGSVGQTDNQQSGQTIDWSQFPVPPGMSEYAFRRVIGENSPTAEQLEQIKLGITKFISGGFLPDSDILIHLIVAAADTRFSVANLADLELKKIVGTLDWSSPQLAAPLYTLFLGSDVLATQKDLKQKMKRSPASTRIRLKLLHYFCRVTNGGLIIPPCIQVVFESLREENTNSKLKSLALQFLLNIVQQCPLAPIITVAGAIINRMLKLISKGEDTHKIMAYTVVSHLGQRIPSLFNKLSTLLQELFVTLETAEAELQRTVRDLLLSITSAFLLNKDDTSNITLMHDLLSTHIESNQFHVRYAVMHYAANVFPFDDVPSRYLLLLACGDTRYEISTEARKALYEGNRKDSNKDDKIELPSFSKLVSYIHTKMESGLSASSTKKINVGSKVLPYSINTFVEIITYLRVCLTRSANIEVSNEPLQHPCATTAILGRYLDTLYKEEPDIIEKYLSMILLLAQASPSEVSLQALLELVGCIPQHLTKLCQKELPWLLTLFASTKLEIKELAAKVYGIIVAYLPADEFETRIDEIIDMANKKNFKSQHGALLALAYTMERALVLKKKENNTNFHNWKSYNNVVKVICGYLRDNTLILMEAAIQGIGMLGKTSALPIPNDGDEEPNKKAIVESLFSVANNVKFNTKVREKAVLSLGYLCVGENFPHTEEIVQRIISTVKETKDIEIHLILEETLVHCVQGQASPEARDAWTTLPSEHNVPYSEESTALLARVLDQLLSLYKDPHPNSTQAICVWFLALLKHNIQRDCVKERLTAIHQAFMDFLSYDSDIIQDMAAKGLSLIHINSTQEDRDALVSGILEQFIHGRRTTQQVTPDTKLFEEGELGKTPSQGSITTYKEICSLATELQKPDLVYYFMHLANNNAVWTSKKGAAFGFAAIANVATEELNKYLPSIVPRLYRYQFHPTPKIQQSMASIWRAIVPSTSKVIEQYHKEILADITENLTNNEYKVRISCCNALSDLLRANTQLSLVSCAPEIWKKLFRVMDDIHEGTRLAATQTTKVFSKVCVRYCDSTHGKEGEEMIQAILPVLLDIGVIHKLGTIRSIALQTVSQLVSTAGSLLKPSLVTLLPALLSTIGESENPKLSYLSNVCGRTSETQDAIDNIRASAAKGHYATETITKCIQYIDADILKDLIPKVLELIKCSVEFGTKIACSHFLILLSVHAKQMLQPYTGKVLSALMNGLHDRNAAVRKNNAVTIGQIVGSAKQSSLQKLFTTLNTWYMERDEDTLRFTIGQTLQAINNYNQEILRDYSKIVIPLTFFAMHVEKSPENQATVELWTDLWNDIALGTETGIRQNLQPITEILKQSLESSSWTTKTQAANAICTVSQKLGNDMDAEARDVLLKSLAEALRGRTWDGKERLVDALATLTCNSKEALNENNELRAIVEQTLYRECKKESLEYRRHALQAFAKVLHELDIDKFSDIYSIAQETLSKISAKKTDEEGETVIKTGKLQEAIYTVLGQAWPSVKETQDKYCIEILSHCHTTLPNSIRSVQVVILVSLNLFVDKLALLKVSNEDLTPEDRELLDTICEKLNETLKYSIGVAKYTGIKKEALNIILSLGKKLYDKKNSEQFDKLGRLFESFLPELTKDSQPEIRTRVVDIKDMFKV